MGRNLQCDGEEPPGRLGLGVLRSFFSCQKHRELMLIPGEDVKIICRLRTDMRKLPKEAFDRRKRYMGLKRFYEASYLVNMIIRPIWSSRCGIRIPGNPSCWIFLGSLAERFHVACILIKCRRPLDHLGWMFSGGWIRINFPNRLSRNILHMVQISSRNSESSSPLGISRSSMWVSFSAVLPYLERDSNYRRNTNCREQ